MLLSLLGYAAVSTLGGPADVSRLVIGEQGTSAAQVSVRQTAETCRSVQQEAVTFTFDAAHACGAFVNGDPWVAPLGAEPVVITAVSPAPADGRNGWMINPDSRKEQTYDSRIGGYDEELVPSLPHVAQPGESIVKAVSNPGKCGNSSGHPTCLRSATVLTVLRQPPPDQGATVFRPPYFGDDKPLISTASIRPDLLPALPAVSGAPSLEAVEKRFRGVQLDHLSSWKGRYVHPAESFSFGDGEDVSNYGSDLAKDNNDAALRLMLDDPFEDKLPALINYLQAGIDWYGTGKAGVTHPADGGHSVGRKVVVTFAAVVLDHPDMKAVAGRTSGGAYSENRHVYYSETVGRPLFGKDCKDGMYDEVRTGGKGSRDCRDPLGEIDGGEVPGSTYQFCCTAKAYKASSLVARLLPGGRSVWNADHFHDYVDRWVSSGAWTVTDTHGRTFETGDDTWVESAALHGTNADGGYYGSTFQDNMWTQYRSPADE